MRPRSAQAPGWRRYPVAAKPRLALRIWWRFALVLWALRRRPLPQVAAAFAASPPRRAPRTTPAHLGRMVHRALRIGPVRARCLHNALVLLCLLREEGVPAELVIGLPAAPTDPGAHAWCEVDGRDVGPPPGRFGHRELMRYP